MNRIRLAGSSDMFANIRIAHQAALSFARNLMVATMVIAVGTQCAVITAEDHEGSLTVA